MRGEGGVVGGVEDGDWRWIECVADGEVRGVGEL